MIFQPCKDKSMTLSWSFRCYFDTDVYKNLQVPTLQKIFYSSECLEYIFLNPLKNTWSTNSSMVYLKNWLKSIKNSSLLGNSINSTIINFSSISSANHCTVFQKKKPEQVFSQAKSPWILEYIIYCSNYSDHFYTSFFRDSV